MILSGISVNLSRMYSGRVSEVLRYELLISAVINFAPFVDTTLLNSDLATIISAVGVATFPGN